MLERKIDALQKSLIEFMTLIEDMIDASVNGLLKKDLAALESVMVMEEKANQYEITIEDECLNTIAQFQPLARDLRSIITILKMSNDLERMGDHAVNLADHASDIIGKNRIKPFIDLPRMADLVSDMVKESISSFIEGNTDKAEHVLKIENDADALRDQIVRELITYMIGDSQKIEQALRLIEIARNLERIGDLATNIAEDTIYVVKGKNIKHSGNPN